MSTPGLLSSPCSLLSTFLCHNSVVLTHFHICRLTKRTLASGRVTLKIKFNFLSSDLRQIFFLTEKKVANHEQKYTLFTVYEISNKAVLAPIIMYIESGRWWDPGCICVSVSTYWVVDSSKHSECTFENTQFSFLFVFTHSLTPVNTKRWTRRALNQHWGFVLGERDLYGSFNFNWILTQVAQFNIAQFLTLFFWWNFK